MVPVRPFKWKPMSEADRVFQRRENQRPQTSREERRVVVSPPRKGPAGSGRSRVVEVVHLRRDGLKPEDARPRSTAGKLRAQTWPEGFRARSTLPPTQHDVEPVSPGPPPPIAHMMPVWAPPPQRDAERSSIEADATARTDAAGPNGSAMPKAPKPRTRRFADPFATDDNRANCLRCGYLVEKARDRRGLMTCATCD